jgi:nicotinamidase-related amidase
MPDLRIRLRYAAVAGVLILALAALASAGDILDQWTNITLPPMPELKPVTLQGPTTALLILDMLTNQCAPNSRCAATVPTIKRLHDAARAAGAMVWYSMPGANTMPADIVDPALTPRDGEWERVNGPDKFMFSSLDEKLKAHGVKTVIVCGHSFQGVGIGTGSASAERGYQVIIPVDCLSSGDNYGEQYAAWHLYKGGPNTVISKTTLTRSTMMKF